MKNILKRILTRIILPDKDVYRWGHEIIDDMKTAPGKRASLEAFFIEIFNGEIWAGTQNGILLRIRFTENRKKVSGGIHDGYASIIQIRIIFTITNIVTQNGKIPTIFGNLEKIEFL